MEDTPGIFDLIRDHTYTRDKCFLCGCALDETNATAEHIIPKWLIRKFNLWNIILPVFDTKRLGC
jgi:hypothetical protein